ncbi:MULTISPECIES: hypothetical protein [unclassified Curtobacterium]|uniref:hypothetical protein n=1 Tax=unclassified Curtobacterium TaxID=257496 RepID=UPI0014955044|nr:MULTISPECIES: hypothetical protein [unclassified Curtobacterium]WIA97421.1 hypothetical protein QOL16_03225 [Curtobacterium sp. MCBA15_004]WIB00741.1 hypothetical protein QOL15_03335 [Curtobacterium sp. MCBA15_012]
MVLLLRFGVWLVVRVVRALLVVLALLVEMRVLLSRPPGGGPGWSLGIRAGG